MKRWVQIYEEWRYWNPELEKDERMIYVRMCRMKLAHPNFLTAMLTARQMERQGTGENITIYYCPICYHTHLGNLHGTKRLSDKKTLV